MTFEEQIPDPQALFDYISDHGTTDLNSDHGPRHWAHVAKVGARLCKNYPHADPVVVFLFSLFHDANRLSEFEDPNHGQRGRVLAWNLFFNKSDLFTITDQQMSRLTLACDGHTEAFPPAKHPPLRDPDINSTLAVCWDSDRLNLARVGIWPEPQYLFTEEAKGMIEWASVDLLTEPPSWRELGERYSGLVASRS